MQLANFNNGWKLKWKNPEGVAIYLYNKFYLFFFPRSATPYLTSINRSHGFESGWWHFKIPRFWHISVGKILFCSPSLNRSIFSLRLVWLNHSALGFASGFIFQPTRAREKNDLFRGANQTIILPQDNCWAPYVGPKKRVFGPWVSINNKHRSQITTLHKLRWYSHRKKISIKIFNNIWYFLGSYQFYWSLYHNIYESVDWSKFMHEWHLYILYYL